MQKNLITFYDAKTPELDLSMAFVVCSAIRECSSNHRDLIAAVCFNLCPLPKIYCFILEQESINLEKILHQG